MSTGQSTSPAMRSGLRVNWLGSARVLVRLAWARTGGTLLVTGLVVLLLLPMVFAMIFASRGSLSGDPVEFLVRSYDSLLGGMATPLIALLLGTSAFSAESEDGTLLYLVTTTTPRWWIVLVRVCFAAVLTGALSALAVWGTGTLAAGSSDPEGVTTAYTVSVFFGGFTYAALFTALALFTRRALVSGLVYVLFWEGALSDLFPALQYLSVRQWMRGIAAPLTTADTPADLPSVTYALVAASLLVLITVYAGGRKLHAPRISRMGT